MRNILLPTQDPMRGRGCSIDMSGQNGGLPPLALVITDIIKPTLCVSLLQR
jgi:hypothetical protein